MNRRSALLALAGLAAGAPSSRGTAADTVTLVDDRGVRVTAPLAPGRIAAISYVPVDVALALGVVPVATTYMVQGRDPAYLLGLTARMRQIGQRAQANLELLAEARPDVTVAVRRYTEGNAARFAAIAPYLAYDLEVFADSDRIVVGVATLLGRADGGRDLNTRFREDLAGLAAQVPDGPRVRFQLMWAGVAPFTFYSEYMAAALAIAVGGANIAGPAPAASARSGFEISLEAMLAEDPEVIFVYDSGPDRPHEANPVWAMLSAVRNGRVHYVGDHWVEPHGPVARQIVMREAAHYLHPSRFPKPDIRVEAEAMIPARIR